MPDRASLRPLVKRCEGKTVCYLRVMLTVFNDKGGTENDCAVGARLGQCLKPDVEVPAPDVDAGCFRDLFSYFQCKLVSFLEQPRRGRVAPNNVARWGSVSLSKEAEYRRFAAALLKLANRTENLHDKSRLLAMAEAWLGLACRTTKPARQEPEIPEHPLVKTKFAGRVF